MASIMIEALLEEYDGCVELAGQNASDNELIGSLVANHAWTQQGAQTIVFLAREYGTAILRNALALAAALDIEDGSSGL
jgi:hypothetical protein